MNKYIVILLSIIVAFSATNSEAKMPSIKDTAVPVNTQVPEITAVGINGEAKSIKQLSGEKGLVLVFFRSADWCPYCKRHLVEINQWNKKLNGLGYKVAAISYDPVSILKKFSDKRNIQYPLLADQNHKTMQDLNVLNDEYEPGDDHYGIPFPGVMVIDENGKLVYKYFYQGYKKRVKMEELFMQLQLGL